MASEKAVVVRDTQAVAAPVVTPMTMLAMAIEKGTSVEQLTQLMALQERWEANEARKAFDAALAAFKANAPALVKDKRVSFETQKGRTEYNHATLGNVATNVAKALSEHGLSHRWDVSQGDGGVVSVTCILTHVLGHRERTTMQSSLDQSGGKNNIQALGSATTYLQRYTLLAAVGLATVEQDDDGAASGRKPGTLDPDEEAQFLTQIQTATDRKELLGAIWKRAADACHAIPDPAAHKRLKDAVTARAKTLQPVEKDVL